MRPCYKAQEEIWKASHEEAALCTPRHHARVRPVCSEGDRFGDDVVWRTDVPDLVRNLLCRCFHSQDRLW